ncbi:MAG: DUF2064 domain-containing protein [Proteobacteria bacterium]|nr:DUF2064 domain-containing protein [Pseudomonadota bacterium]
MEVEMAYYGGNEALLRSWVNRAFSLVPQAEGDLGRKMDAVFQAGLNDAVDKIVLVGTDCPELTVEILQQAFRALDENDLVLGPARDGGYYCVGLSQARSELFEAIPWGTDRVLARTLAAAQRLELKTDLLPELHDVDRPEDLPLWEEIKTAESDLPTVSVIIPTLNEEAHIQKAIRSVRSGFKVEIIVVDGGSCDRTLEIAREETSVKVLESRSGRSLQMNLGASSAEGEYLLFLHADTYLPNGFDTEIRRILTLPDVAAGAFTLRVDDDRQSIRLVEWMVALRSKLLKLPYGDQGLFLTSDRFQRTGGFPDLPIMEDFEYVRRLRKSAAIVLSELSVVTSGRRWEKLGVARTTLVNQIVVLLYFLGVSPDRLRRRYRKASSVRENDNNG